MSYAAGVAISENVARYVRLAREIDALDRAGDPRAEIVRDAAETALDALTQDEHRELAALDAAELARPG